MGSRECSDSVSVHISHSSTRNHALHCRIIFTSILGLTCTLEAMKDCKEEIPSFTDYKGTQKEELPYTCVSERNTLERQSD